MIEQVEDPKTELHKAWAHLKAPDVAINYWRLPPDASFTDTLKCMFADESHHRDVNHTLAELSPEQPSPFAMQHKEDAIRAYELHRTGTYAWPERKQREDGKTTSVLPLQ